MQTGPHVQQRGSWRNNSKFNNKVKIFFITWNVKHGWPVYCDMSLWWLRGKNCTRSLSFFERWWWPRFDDMHDLLDMGRGALLFIYLGRSLKVHWEGMEGAFFFQIFFSSFRIMYMNVIFPPMNSVQWRRRVNQWYQAKYLCTPTEIRLWACGLWVRTCQRKSATQASVLNACSCDVTAQS